MAKQWAQWLLDRMNAAHYRKGTGAMLMPGLYLVIMPPDDEYIIFNAKQSDGSTAWVAVYCALDEAISPAFEQKKDLLDWMSKNVKK